ncbi:peptidoglycan-binding lipoprotein ion transport porin, OmpA family [Psychroflexus gondwanensis ACAM 44]|uniref:Peptidoglycan-binding lipoprotein ion transport porin, OmpA family n=1 Tax=Psychroflexus gondwanensis ACAM 44 TaxID=1189619 RepID=N1WN94_9FLAO|nr:OmpA family protein [Psychroflexus gondwanensis]EMY81766.1 peptidoglycan-binding lipoprotein ion transport porin, OmpA family [Psychroflexus gondwanensis ACAM 44]
MKLKTNKILGLLLAIAFLFSSCEAVKNTNKTQRGGAAGAAGGAVIGGVIGNNTGDGDNSVLGAIIGGVVGGAAGAYIGNRMDKQAKDIDQEIPGAEVTRVGEGINVTFDENSGVYFATEKSNIAGESEISLLKLIGIFQKYPKTNIIVEGHTDSTGSDSYNMDLSKRRAQSVTDYLSSNGISTSRINTNWYGEEQPKFDNTTPEGRSKNRRVELAIVASEELKDEARQKAQ